jgi:glycosyltransferase involved in cell wall biosynthesis
VAEETGGGQRRPPHVGEVAETVESASWPLREPPTATVVVATHNRSSYLSELFSALAGQKKAPAYDVVIVDDASVDATWDVLQPLVRFATFPVRALRLRRGVGPSVARNSGAAGARGCWLVFTDDDCIPEPGWLAGLLAAGPSVDLIQGRTQPAPGGRPAPWARTIDVRAATPLYETCNLAVRRTSFLRHGGFPVLDLLPGPAARGFGEDAALGARVAHEGGRAFAADGVVRHRWLPGTFRDHLRGEWRLVAFPALTSHVPDLEAVLWRGKFLNRRTATVDLGLAGIAVATMLRRPAPAVVALPWALRRIRDARRRGMSSPVLGAGQLMVADLVGAAALAYGSLRARRFVL